MAVLRSDPPLDRDSAVPMFEQIKERLERAIAAGEFAVHERIPSERELSTQYGVSRMTIRQALGALARSGALYARSGKGTFVAELKIEQPLQRLTSFTEDMRARGLRPSSRLLAAERIGAPLEIADALGLSPGAELVRISRLRLADDEPLALEIAQLPHARCPGILSYDLGRRSLYEVLHAEYGISLARARQTIEAATPDDDERALLHLPHGVPVLRIRRLTHASDGAPIEFVRSAYRGDRYQLGVELR